MQRSTLIICMVLMSYAARSQWTYKGLGGEITNQLTIDQDTIFASTSSGLFKKYLFSNDTLWQSVSFAGKAVLNTLFLDQQSCLIMVASDPVYHKVLVYRSGDRGQTSSLFIPDTASYPYPHLAHMARSPFGKDTIYLLNHQLKTYDGGQSWMPLGHAQQSDNFIYINPADPREVFIGGENFALSPFLQHSTDNAQNWAIEDCSSYFAGDNALEVLHVVDGDWYAAGEGIIAKKTSGTSLWTQLLNVFSTPSWGLYMFGFAFSPVNNDFIYASGDNSSPDINDKLRLFKSSDRGQSWDSLSYSIPGIGRYGVNDLKVQHVWGEDRVWLGGFGVFTYSQGVTTGVDKDKSPDGKLNFFPNPASDVLNVVIKGNTGKLAVKVVNTVGQQVFAETYNGNDNIRILLNGWAKGMYYCSIQTGEGERGFKFVKD